MDKRLFWDNQHDIIDGMVGFAIALPTLRSNAIKLMDWLFAKNAHLAHRLNGAGTQFVD